MLADVCAARWFPGFLGCSGWDLSDCLNTGPAVMRRCGAVGTEQTSSFTSATSRVARLGSNAGCGCSGGCLLSLQHPISIPVTSSPWEQSQSLERQKEGRREKDAEKGRNNLFILPCAGCQLETAKGNGECVHDSVRTSWVIHDVLCENASCVLCVFFLKPLPPSFCLPLLSRAQSLLFFSVKKYSLVVKC